MIAMALSWKDFWTRHGYPALYVPQLLGYARIALALHAFAVAMVRPSQTVSLYALSFVCDELDGRFARMLGQSTQFGALLDMVTDRVATTGLAAIVYARAVAVLDADTVCPVALVLFSLVALDIFSHWMHMTSVHAGHGIKTSHKETRSSQPVGSRALAHRLPLTALRSPLTAAAHRLLLDLLLVQWLIRQYYSKRMLMGACCVSVEVLLLSLYALSFNPTDAVLQGVIAASLPGFVLKQVANVLQLVEAAKALLAMDARSPAKSPSRSRSRSKSSGRSRR